MRRNIWESAIGEVGKSAKVFLGRRADVLVQIGGDGGCLVIRTLEVIAEASGPGDPSDFRADGLSATDGGDVRTCAGELRRKLWSLFAVIGLTGCTHACGLYQLLIMVRIITQEHRDRSAHTRIACRLEDSDSP